MPKNGKTLCLNMIVKNEAHVITDTFDNLRQYFLFDYWVISDTGSTDNTKEVINNYFKNANIPGELVEHEWKNFGYNRTKALESAYNKTDLLLIFDADDRMFGDFKLPNDLNADMYMLIFGKVFKYNRPLLINNRKRFRFKGVLHEFLSPDDKIVEGKIEGDYYIESGRTGNRSKDPEKYFKDAKILEKGFEEENDNGLKDRYAFYCAQSYKDYGPKTYDESIKWYLKVLERNNWTQEKYYSCLMLGDLYKMKNDNFNALKYWTKSIEYDSERIEGIAQAMELLFVNGIHAMNNMLYHHYKNYNKNPMNKLFINMDRYRDHIEYYNSIAAYYVNDNESGYECCKKILENNIADKLLIDQTFKNIIHYQDKVKKDSSLFYLVDKYIEKNNDSIQKSGYDLWNKLFEIERINLAKSRDFSFTNKKKPIVMITFTTCKRFDLFEQTINSILNTWQDVSKIDYWFCVDDNSNKEDRKKMKEKYFWMEYYFKNEEEKGHRQSMNIIWDKLNKLKPKYWIHMEDDFLFHCKMNYVTQSIKYLNELKEKNIYQILFNRGYGETIEDYKIKSYVGYNEEVVIHDYKEGTFQYANCHYWPHYSFRPSMIQTEIILKLGNYDSPNQFFEMDYARKWMLNGFKSAFFNLITCKHIGKLTSDKIGKNAYTLNNESQFEKKEEQCNLIKIINLKRRPDRKENVIEKMKNAGISNYQFVEAVDGNELIPTTNIRNLFRGNDFGNRKGVIGCALTHYNLWIELINNPNADYYFIMEDDFTICDQFKKVTTKLEKDAIFKNSELLLMGYHMFSKNREIYKEIYDSTDYSNIKIGNLNRDLFIGATHCYTINKKGAMKLCDYILENGIKHGIDYLFKIVLTIEAKETQPLIAFAEWNEQGKNIDSDIQNNYDSFDFNISKEDLMKKYDHYKNLDFYGSDICYSKPENLFDQLIIAENNKDCVAFNTLGYFKNNVNTENLISLSNCDLYVKKNEKKGEIKIFYNIACLNNWKNIVNDQLSRIIETKLYDKASKIHCFLISAEVEREENIKFVESFGSKIKVELTEEKGDESLTLSNLKKYIGQNDKFLFIHCNDVTKFNNDQYKNFEDSRKIIECFLIDKFEKCIEELNNYDTVGINYFHSPPHFSGNFWWATQNYFSQLPELGASSVEAYIFLGNPKYKSLFQENDKYNNEISLEKYIFIEGFDQKDCDLYYRPNKSIDELKKIADVDNNCVCFNTLGFFKNSISNLVKSPYFSGKDGLYVKKDWYNRFLDIQNDNFKNSILDSINNSSGYFCFIHSCNLGNTLILDNLIDYLNENLLDVNVIFVINIGEEIKKDYGEKIKIIQYSSDTNLFEIPTINLIHSFSFRNPNSNILYLHTKGVSYNYPVSSIDDWKNMMLHFLVKKQTECLDLLEYYDTVGCNYQEKPHPHFSGNFWWAKASYICGLKKLKTNVKHDAEWWLFSDNLNVKYYSIHNSFINHYQTLYHPSEYENLPKYIRVKMLCNWCSSKTLCQEWSNMCQNGYRWKNIEITWENYNIDYWVIINKPSDNSYYDPKKTIVFQMEPWVMNESHLWGVKTWGDWAEPNENKFLAVRGRKTKCHNNTFWQLELTESQIRCLDFPYKIDKVASICSSKYFDEGHIARIDFLKFMEKKGDIPIDIFNADNQHGFKNYRGQLSPYVDKSKGIVPYKYYFMVENNYEEGFITEKIWEPILCETLVFYYGCPNITSYINPEAFVQLDMKDFEKSYQIVKKAIAEDWWSIRIDAIKKEKKRILDELAFFPVISGIIGDKYDRNKWIEKISSAWTGHRLFAEWLVNKMDPEVVVELGVDFGYSTFVFATSLRGRKGTIYGVDLFLGDFQAGKRNTYEYVMEKIRRYDITNIDIIVGDFTEISKSWSKPIDILHIDGLHTYGAVKNDYDSWSKYVKEDGIILFHDTAIHDYGVKDFFREVESLYKLYFIHSAGLGILTKNKDLYENIVKSFDNVYDNMVNKF